MGARQVLRIAVVAAVAAAAALGVCTGCPGRASEPVRVGVIEARPYGVAYAPLGALEGVALVANDALLAADAAEDALATHRCDATTGRLVEAAALSRLASGSKAAAAELPELLGLAFECAHAAGERDAARTWLTRLRALGAPEPAGAEVAYPEIDATSNAQPVKLRVEAAGGGEVTVDLRPVGVAPLEVLVEPGRHLVGAPGIAVAYDVTNRPPRQLVALPAPSHDPVVKLRESLQDRVRAWRRGGAPDENSLAQVMRDAGLVLTVVLVPAGDAEVWKTEPDGGARRVTTVPKAEPVALARAIRNAAGRL